VTVLAATALAGVRLRVAGADTPVVRAAVARAGACGAHPVEDGAPAAQVLVGARTPGAAGVGDGTAAAYLVEAFTALRDVLAELPDGGGAVLLVETAQADDPTAGAVRALCRSLALEHAPRGVRVNVVLVPPGGDAGDLVPMLLGPAAAMMTGAVLEVA
jgi:hypothetical protein